jgi:DNA polymerase elongation subunit (family B)
LKKATAIAEAQGFKLVHGIVDSMWLQKKDATDSEYKDLCKQIEQKLDLPISFEGRYKWIVFLNSRVDPRTPVLNRYYGVFSNGKLKVRGIELRRHDTAEIIRKCQSDMLTVLSQANNSHEFRILIPKALAVMKHYVMLLRTGRVPTEELIIEKRLSKAPEEYSNLVEQAIAAVHLVRKGGSIHAGQSINYLITRNKSGISQNRSLPAELVDESTHCDLERYVELLLSSVMNLLLPFDYDIRALTKLIQSR